MEHSYLWGLIEKKMCTFLERFKKSKNVWLRALMQSDCLDSFFKHYNRILQCYFEDVCRPQRIRTSPGLSLDWTLLLTMRFSCPYTLDVLLYQVLWVSKQLCQESVCNVVLCGVVSEQTIVCNPVVLPPTPLQNVLSGIINLCCADSVCLCSTDFVSGSKIKMNISYNISKIIICLLLNIFLLSSKKR